MFFPQVHAPGGLRASDFTNLPQPGVTLGRQPFDYRVCHVVLTHPNWETVILCFSASLEALSTGLQNGLWEVTGVPRAQRIDCLSAAVRDLDQPEALTHRYRWVLRHYRLQPKHTNPASLHENGDV